jgi:hypothetical protein
MKSPNNKCAASPQRWHHVHKGTNMQLVLVAILSALPLAALADDATPGLWRVSNYTEDETGKRTACEGADACWSGLPPIPNSGTLCASVQDLRAFAGQQLRDIATLVRGMMHNCTDAADGSVSCDGGGMTQAISGADAAHFGYTYTTRDAGHRITRQWFYERIGDDCSPNTPRLIRRSP